MAFPPRGLLLGCAVKFSQLFPFTASPIRTGNRDENCRQFYQVSPGNYGKQPTILNQAEANHSPFSYRASSHPTVVLNHAWISPVHSTTSPAKLNFISVSSNKGFLKAFHNFGRLVDTYTHKTPREVCYTFKDQQLYCGINFCGLQSTSFNA